MASGGGSFTGFLLRSMGLLRVEAPAAYALMCARLAPRELSTSVDGELCPLQFAAESVRVLAASVAPSVEVQTTRRTILDLVDARLTLADAVWDERLLLRGGPADLIAFHDGFTAWLHGAVRSPSFPDLLRDYRAGTPGPIHEQR
ncbi:MAG: hypothetical protein EXR72_07540 [Myxococcales bacterium]|nr:hypothetical protein [Myxococcales bacterium]